MADTVMLPAYSCGPDVYVQVPVQCASRGTRVLLIGGPKALRAARGKLQNALAGSDLVLLDGELFPGECTDAQIERYASQARQLHAEMIFGMGGGKALDTAKGAALQAQLPVFTFPTIASTCAASSALSVVYREDRSFEKFLYLPKPAEHIFIDPQIIADAPDKYLRAGMGDTIGKYFECWLSARGDELDYRNLLGRKISDLCHEPLLQYGPQALEDCRAHRISPALVQAVLAVVISTGLVSVLVKDEYNGAVAHSLYYALCTLPGFEQNHLHGDVVAYGVLVQLLIDQQPEKAAEVKGLLRKLGIQTTMKELGIGPDRGSLAAALADAVREPDMSHLPYPIDADMIWQGMQAAEQLPESQL